MEQQRHGMIIGPDSADAIMIGNFGTTLIVHGEATAGAYAVVEHTLAPGVLGAPLHRHTNEDEASYILEGELTVQLGERILTAPAGTFVVKPRGEYHTFWNAGHLPVRFLETISPAGFERYFVELADIISASNPPDPAALEALAARFALRFDWSSLDRLMTEQNLHLG